MSTSIEPRSRNPLVLPVAAGVLLSTALLPAGLVGWVGWLSPLVEVPVSPISQALRAITASRLPADEPGIAALKEEAEGYRRLWLAERAENERHRTLIAELQRGVSLNPSLPVRQLTAPVTRASSDLTSGMLSIRAGQASGVDTTTVATVPTLQLVGRVAAVQGPVCRVLPITARGAGKIGVRVMLADASPDGLQATLAPVGDGTLRGDVEFSRPDGTSLPPPEVGMTVRLDDPVWPESARMLIVGTVVAVERSPQNSLRSVVIVRPTADIEHVSEVTLRILDTGEARTETGR